MTLKGKLILALLAAMGFSYIYGNYQDSEMKAKEDAAKERETAALIKNFEINKVEILEGINNQIDVGNYSDALALISKWQVVGDKDINEIFKTAKTGSLLAELKKVPVEKYERNFSLYTELAKLNPNTNKYKDKINFYADKVKQEKIKSDEIAARKKLLESGFSKWDGSHLALERRIIKSMNDPDSYEHIETSYIDYGDHLLVLTKFRGNNAFGAKIINNIVAKVSLSGDVIEIIE